MHSDIYFKEIQIIFEKTFNSEIYYSKSIHSMLLNFEHKYISIDEIDFHILYFLKQGLKSNFLKNYIPRTNSAIEKRKYKLKDIFGFERCSDEQLVKEAIKIGIL